MICETCKQELPTPRHNKDNLPTKKGYLRNMYIDFLDDTIYKGEYNDKVTIDDLYPRFISWYNNDKDAAFLPDKMKLLADLTKCLGSCTTTGGWVYIKMRPPIIPYNIRNI